MMVSFSCLTVILFGLGTLDAALWQGYSLSPGWEVVDGATVTDNNIRPQETLPFLDAGKMTRAKKYEKSLEMPSLMRRLADALIHIRMENNGAVDSATWDGDSDEDDEVIVSNTPPPSIFGGARQRPLIPKRAHGKCGIFKICSPLRIKQN